MLATLAFTNKHDQIDACLRFSFREIHYSSLEALPEGLFDDVPHLEILRVTSSKLSSLPADLFRPLTSLHEL